ncbi:RNA methyltransferase [Methanococcus voltae]|uniref:RNA methyltransferase n=1 Tax=Methanococcus voltae TaxID=2188 RepID=UPI001AEAC479|nr:RNA methyltransferase [Methanococcus voltae]MBP2172259.1 TrmH family RNA methyltransferase [Methanococcus voltae]
MKTTVILVNPKYSGNLGAIARNMMNFDTYDLRIVQNKDDEKPETVLNNEAFIRAVHAKEILENAKFYKTLEEASFDIDYLIATTGAVSGGDKNIKRIPMTPRKLAEKSISLKGNIGIVFGREDDGLRNEDVELCDLLVSIPTCSNYPIMNLSHAVAVILYELYNIKIDDNIPYDTNVKEASKEDKDILLNIFNDFVDKSLIQDHKKPICKTIFKRVISRAFISGREANSLMCVFKDKVIGSNKTKD